MTVNIFPHHDKLETRYQDITTQDKLEEIHKLIGLQLPQIDRIAIALPDTKTDLLKTFISSNKGKSPLVGFCASAAYFYERA